MIHESGAHHNPISDTGHGGRLVTCAHAKPDANRQTGDFLGPLDTLSDVFRIG